MDRKKLLNKGKQKGPTLKVYYVPLGLRAYHHNKQKRNKYYVHKGYKEPHRPIYSAMMSGDSPNAAKHDLSEFKDNSKTPSPSPPSSKDAAVQIHNANPKSDLASSALCEHTKEISKSECSNESNDTRKNEDEILATAEEIPLKADKLQPGGNCISRNANYNRLDGASIKSKARKEEEEEESCGIKCLYYTLQCCECTLM